MDIVVWIELIVFVFLMLLSGFFSSSETAFFSLNQIQLEQMRRDGSKKLKLIEQLLSEPRRLIVTILIGNEFVNVAASVISAAVVIRFFGADNKLINLLVMVPILLLFGEITPKTLAIKNNIAFAEYEAGPISFFAKMIYPIRVVIRAVSDFFITLIVGQQRSRGNILTKDMVRTIAQEAVGEGTLDKTEAVMMNQILDFGSATLTEVKTPRSQLTCYPETTPLTQILQELRQAGHTKAPIFHADRDEIVGVLHARDLVNTDISRIDSPEKLRAILRPSYLVPENKLAKVLYNDFRESQRTFALTVDEFGGITGLVTIEDLLECVFGETRGPQEQVGLQKLLALDDDTYLIDASMDIDVFEEIFAVSIDDQQAETIAGFVLHQYGELPPLHTPIQTEHHRFYVTGIEGHSIVELIMQKQGENVDSTDDVGDPDLEQLLATSKRFYSPPTLVAEAATETDPKKGSNKKRKKNKQNKKQDLKDGQKANKEKG